MGSRHAQARWRTSLRNPDPNVPYPCRTARGLPTPYATDTMALYAFDTIKFGAQWQASAGLRWDNYRTSSRPSATEHYSRTPDNLLNYQLGLVYKPCRKARSMQLTVRRPRRPLSPAPRHPTS